VGSNESRCNCVEAACESAAVLDTVVLVLFFCFIDGQ
jgi:hypothetical protein